MKNTRLYPRVRVDTAPVAAVAQAGGVTLTETIAATGLDVALSRELAGWRRPLATHDPAKIVLDLALTVAMGGRWLADIDIARSEPQVYGRVASDPTVSRLVDTLATAAPTVLKAIDGARAEARARAWSLAGKHAPDHAATAKDPLIIDLDATLVTSHSDKEQAERTWKKGYGFHPLAAFVDHGVEGTGEPLVLHLRRGNAGSNTAADHIAVCRRAFAQLPGHRPGDRPGRRVLVRTDGAGATHDFTDFLHRQRVTYSVGFTLPTNTADLLKHIPEQVWAPAYNADGKGDGLRKGAWVAELTGLLDLNGWPNGMRVIVRKERPHPGAQLRITDVDGMRVTAFATNTPTGRGHGQLADLELRHRRRARCEDRIRNTKDTGLRGMPLHDFNQNQIWCAIVTLAGDLLAWMAMLALVDTHARRWEPGTLRMRLFTIPATLARHGRRTTLHYADKHPEASLVALAVTRLQALQRPSRQTARLPQLVPG